MPRIRRTQKICPNCDYTFSGTDNYCPNCGQENHHHIIPFSHILSEVAEGLWHFDSKFWNTCRYLITSPGKLTKDFNDGKRARYVPPIRLYVFITFLFFFLFGMALSRSHQDKHTTEKTEAHHESSDHASETDTTKTFIKVSDEKLYPHIPEHLEKLKYIYSLSSTQLDSMFLAKGDKKPGAVKKFLLRVVVKTSIEDSYYVIKSFKSNLAFVMFGLMPIFALLLKLIYIRRKRYYMELLIFSIHTHCVAFLLLSISFAFSLFLNVSSVYPDILLFLGFVTYLVISIKHVFQQSWLKSIFKSLLLLSFYLFILALSLASLLLYSAVML